MNEAARGECTRKVRYDRPGQALNAARKLPIPGKFYRCRFCNGFHVTSEERGGKCGHDARRRG